MRKKFLMMMKKENRRYFKRFLAFVLAFIVILQAFYQYGLNFTVKAEEKDGETYTIYVDTSMVGADAELLESGIGAYVSDSAGRTGFDEPVLMEKVEQKEHLYSLELDKNYPYIMFTQGADLNAAEQTEWLSIDWTLGAPCFQLNSDKLTDGGAFYGLYTVYFDLNDAEGADAFLEKGVGVYAYDSETESYSSAPVAMKKSDKGEDIYEYSFDKPYKYIAFMNGYDSWNYDTATSPVYTEWGYDSPCFLLDRVNGKESKGLWRNLNCVVYFDASEVKEDKAFVENGVYVYAYNEDGDKLSETPVKMLASNKGEDFYEYTLDKPYEYVQFIFGDSFDAEVQSEIIAIDWLLYAEPCYKMNLARTEETTEETETETETEISEIPEETTEETSEETTVTEPVETMTESSDETSETTETQTEADTAEETEGTSDIQPEETQQEKETVPATEEGMMQPIDGARISTDNLSVVFGVYTMEWLGTENTSEVTVGTVTTDSVSVDGELTDLGEDATKSTIEADVALLGASSSSTRTVYFDTYNNNDSGNGWTTSTTMYIYELGGVSGASRPVKMTKSERVRDGSTGTLWEYPVSEGCTGVIFVSQSRFPNGNNYAPQTVNVYFTDIGVGTDGLYPCFAIGSDYESGTGKKKVAYLGDLGPLSKAGESMYFYDMTSTILGDVTAVFTNENGTEAEVTKNETTGAYVIPADETTDDDEEIPYTTVTFYDENDNPLGDTYNFFNNSSSGTEKFLYNETTKNTFYYGATEKVSGSTTTLISGWGAKSTGTTSLASKPSKTIYFDKLFFSVDDGGQIQIGDGDPITLSADANDSRTLSYTFPSDTTATQQTILTFIAKDGTKYHFFWSDLTVNAVTIDADVASVTDVYKKSVTIYFDATYSKLSYASDGVVSSGIPSGGGTGTIRYYATGSGKTDAEGDMEKVTSRTVDGHTWSDLYKVDLDEGYDTIVFSNYDMSSINNLGGYGNSTAKLTIDTTLNNPCFYADGGDSSAYSNGTGGRGGYWDEVYSIRDAEKGKSTSTDTKDVVDIKSSTFTRDPKVLYVDTTFYDYYSDYELNGYNRDSYGTSTGGSQRNWVTFRQFDQALSDYYEENNASIPIYTGHFQPSYSNWKTRFADVAGTLNLYGYSTSSPNYGRFFSTNNSTLDVSGDANNGNGYYAYAAQGLVSDEMANDNLMMASESGGTFKSPHFDADFLTGNNSKNAVLGEVFENVSFPFESIDRDNNGVNYWTFNSKDTTLAMRYDSTAGYFLEDVGNQGWSKNVNSTSSTTGTTYTYGFFPFNETSTAAVASTYNYGFGTKLEFQFRLTADGTVEDKNGNPVPITFEFSGDDDVWVFIDDQLVLDVGGSHGVVTAEIKFTDDDRDATNGRQITSKVSHVKESAGSSTSGTDVVSYHTLEETTKTEHTLTMYYMERGMWESNMSISFNFPDENQFEVEKQVDLTDVNDLFTDLFEGVSVFEYTIKNQATHYGTVEAVGSDTLSKVVFNDSFDGTVQNVGSNIFAYTSSITDKNSVTKTDVVHWYAYQNDTTGSYRSKRYGTIYADADNDGVTVENGTAYVDISKMSYLEFKYYYDYTDTPSLSYMYLQLIDTEGNIKGNITDYLSGKSYGTVDNASKKWTTVKIDLSTLAEQAGFNDKVVAIKFGYNYPRNFYLDDFIFKPVGQAEETVGFVRKQYTIPDYGSAATGVLKEAENASYTSSKTDEIRLVDEEGHFYLQDGETVVFKDQFRRGSYIYLEETSNPLFDTTWTMYENGQPVTEIVKSTQGVLTTSDSITTLENVEGTKIEDGRTEAIIRGTDEDGITVESGNSYDGTKPSTKNASDNTIVFRSYAYPDDASITTKLKVVYTNKINVGSIQIVKKKKYDNDNLGTYKFKITYSNVGGVALESAEIEQIVEVKAGESITIDGIPVGTYFTVEEIPPEDGSYLDKVEISDPYSMIVEEGNVVKGVVLEKTDDSKISIVTFTNTNEPKISASMTKKWLDEENQTEITSNLPDSITVQLQRKLAGEDDSKYAVVDGYEKITIEPELSDDGSVWSYTVSGLDKVYDYPNADGDATNDFLNWVYRFVELELKEDGTYTVIENGKVITLDDIDYGVQYKDPNDPNEGTESDSSDPVADDTGNFETEITNVLLEEIDLKILKKSTNGTVLSGVKYKLLPYDEESDAFDATKAVEQTTGDDGVATFADLENGTYELTEVLAADGYSLLIEPVIIVINRKEETYTYRMKSEAEADAKSMTLVVNGTAPVTPTLTLNVVNQQNIVLPKTGGTSSIPVMAVGITMCMTAGIMYISNKRRKEGKPPGA